MTNNHKQKGKKMVRKTKKSNKTCLLTRIWRAICWPFKKVWQCLCWAWRQIASADLGALLNLALLLSIIVLFTLLIIDLRKHANADNYEIMTQPQIEETKPVVRARPVTRKITTLPVKRDPVTRKAVATPIQVAKTPVNPVAIKQVPVATVKQNPTVMGDIVVDNHDMTRVLTNGTRIKGNLYIQDLRKYTLPCNIVIEGNLILRDVNMLNFCGDFTVCGNIYVSPRSSFGPVPSTARIGGQIIF